MIRTNFTPITIPKPDTALMERLGAIAIEHERERLARGLNANDEPARPLSPKYVKQKQRAGLVAIRNLMLTGQLLASRRITSATDTSVSVEFTDDRDRLKAEQNDRIEQMTGQSPESKAAVLAELRKLYGAKFTR